MKRCLNCKTECSEMLEACPNCGSFDFAGNYGQVANNPDSWLDSWSNLRVALKIYLVMWLGGGLVMVIRMVATEGSGLAALRGPGTLVFLSSVLPYFVAIVFAYQVQDELSREKHISHGAWQVVVAALFLNPYVLGFYVPLSVSMKARSVARNLGICPS